MKKGCQKSFGRIKELMDFEDRKRFEMKHPTNELVEMDTKGPFYLKGSRNKHTTLFMLYR